MLGSVGLWRAVIRRMRFDGAVNVAAAVLLAAAASLLAIATLYGDTVALGGIRRSIEDAPPVERGAIVRALATPDRVVALGQDVGSELRRSLGAALGEVALLARSGSFAPSVDPDSLTNLASYESVDRHAELLAGAWARSGHDPIEATLSEGAAVALGLTVGDRVALTSRVDASQTVRVVVTGVWRPSETDPYWLGDVLDVRGEEIRGPFVTRGPFVVALDDLVGSAAGRGLDLAWHAIPAADQIPLDGLQALGTSIATLPERLRGFMSDGQSITMTSGLPARLTEIDRSVLVSRGGVAVLTIQFAVLAGYAIVLVAGMIVDRRRIDVALLRSRGAGDRQLATMAVAEAALIALPGAIVAPLVALVAVRALAIGPLAAIDLPREIGLSGDVVLVAILAAMASGVVLAIPAVLSAASPGAVRATYGRQATRPLGQRLGIDLAIVAVAGVALWQLQLYGSPITRNARGVLGLDPLLIAAPAIGLLAGGLLALRIVPRLAEVGERAFSAGRGLVASIGVRQVARRPVRYARAALLLMLAIALGTFGAAYGSTWARSQTDQAIWQAVGDVRMVTSTASGVPAWAVGSVIVGESAATGATPVVREPLDFGRALAGGTLLALDPERVGEIGAEALGLAGEPAPAGNVDETVAERLRAIAADRPLSAAVPVPGTPARLSILLDISLVRPDDPSAPGGPGAPEIPDPPPLTSWDAVRVTIVIEDGNGSIQRLDGGTARSDGAGQRVEVSLQRTLGGFDVAPTYPIRIRAIELRVTAPPDEVVGGRIGVVGLAASDARSGGSWTPIAISAGDPGWAWQRVDRDVTNPAVVDDHDPATVLIGTQPDLSDAVFGFAGAAPMFRLWLRPAVALPIPAIAGIGFLEATGTNVGDSVSVTVRGLRLDVRIVDAFPIMPPLGADEAFLIVDRETVELMRFERTALGFADAEWWLQLPAGSAAEVIERLESSPIRPATVIGREAVAAALTSDPVALGLVGALALGSLAALIFATIGYVASATVSATERLAEFTILRSLGLSNRQLSAWLAIEHTFLLGFGLLTGWALGLLLAWIVLPSATFDATGGSVVPPPVIEVPWIAMSVLGLLSLALLLVTARLVIRRTAGESIGDVLRAGES